MKKCRKAILIVLGLAALTALVYLGLTEGYTYFMKQAYPIKYADIVEKESAENNLDPKLVYAVIRAESNFNSAAKSGAGALGLMQLTPDTFKWLQTKLSGDRTYTEDDLLTPEINIRYGCKLISILNASYPELETALCAYNAGMGTVNKWLKDSDISADGKSLLKIPYPETEKYAAAVLKNYKIYQKLYQ